MRTLKLVICLIGRMRIVFKNVYYIVKVRDDIRDAAFYKTTVSGVFCGTLVNQNGVNFYFELNGSKALVIIPHSWIEWMAPSKELNDMQRRENEDEG